MSETEKLTTAFIISLVAGILIILGNIYTTMWGIGTMGKLAYAAMAGTRVLGLISGIIVLISAIMLKIRPGEAMHGMRACCTMWGTMILVFSIVSLFGGSMSGFLVGAILGIIGGALALSSRPKG